MSGIDSPSVEEEDKAQSTLGHQSAFMSMLNMGIFFLLQPIWEDDRLIVASNFGLDLPEIEDEESDDEELNSSKGTLLHIILL